ncbi:CBY1 interacting BAR domain containing protein Fam92 isoform X1 [Leptinotarsa decemlineata]|uniref:CBY1 interacting BAR domain containing protein Fam92 isoform X1 n=1 Tax=Leptinotarsa decemlineata TaxID=7539 RepID=UPI003D306C07
MLNQFRSRSNCETEAKFIQGRIHSVEKNVAEFCSTFAQYSRKAARLRDKGDEIARLVLNYAETENINKSLAVGLESFADDISIIGDYADMRVRMIDEKVVGEFAKYEDICKHAKDKVRDIYSARDKEVARRRQLDRLRERNPRNRQQIIQAETDLVKATAEVSKSIHNLEDKTNAFEKQKLHDIKSILLDFLTVEIGYHAKCLEILTKAYNDVESINEESDLEDFQKIRGKIGSEFKKSLRIPDTIHHKTVRKSSIFRSSGSLGSLGTIFSSTQNKKTPGIPNTKEKLSKSEDTLDSLKHSITESEEDDSNTEEYGSSSDNRNSPTLVRKFRK